MSDKSEDYYSAHSDEEEEDEEEYSDYEQYIDQVVDVILFKYAFM